jgi:3-oxoadipate enol-lactonase
MRLIHMIPILMFCAAAAQASERALPTATTWAEVNGVTLRYQLLGRGTPIVLLHEMTMTMEVWDDLLPAVTKNHQVLRYDLRGFGLSERIRGDITLDDEVSDLKQLLDSLRIQGKVTLIGGAIGGAIALKFAAAYPDRVLGVVAISPAAYMTPHPERLPTAAPVAAAAPSRSEDPDPLEVVYPKELRRQHPERFAHFLAIQNSSDRASSAASARAIYTTGFSEVLPHIMCPTVVIATSLFKLHSVDDFRELAKAIPRGQLVVLETGHFASAESPEMVRPVVTEFLAKLVQVH